ncbi:hypothetical protein BEL04_21990 [Mucilaginibacter sp. PPCGB 2223]|uniref:DUF6252 family protein n=1 Tax=Mucilaginibacter sp. PPCGB 2223 TaxID=1886027 RepID=UPI000823FD78|nr:DUF6252 family protein [Mucilaginibacter sp. PPCGB 2223]OCX50455.1 hypothetical protein BEL04_21990 [Mucilaginibacter sp. PPCGB 2223]
MKNAGVSFFFLALSIMLFNSCDKGSGSLSTKPVTSLSNDYYITLKVDGVSQASYLNAAILYISTNSIQIVGQLPGNQSVNLLIDDLKTGVFNIAANNTILSYNATPANTDTFIGTIGTVTITGLTTDTVTGTFQFTATNFNNNATKTISNGIFNLKYTRQ